MVSVQTDVLCNLQDKAGMLLDSQSTVDIFCNPKMLFNIHDVKRHLILYCNADNTSVTKKGNLKGYWTVWCHPAGIATVWSLNNLKKKYRVIFNSELENGFVLHKGNRCQVNLNLPRMGNTSRM